MSIKLDPITCKEMEGIPVSDEDCKITKDFILNFVRKLSLDGFGLAYAHGLTRLRDEDEDAIMVQGLYIALNCDTETEEQKEAQYILSHLRPNAPLPFYKPKQNVMTEIEMEHIQLTFQKWTEDKIHRMPPVEDIEDLEDADVFKCTGKPNELIMPQKACHHMSDFQYDIFKNLKTTTQKRLKKLALENIIVNEFGVSAVPSSTMHSSKGIMYRHSEEVENYCSNKPFGIESDVCMVESTTEGKIEGKPYTEVDATSGEDWRFNKLREEMSKTAFHYLSDGIILSKEDAEFRIKEINEEREKNKLSLKDFEDFAELKNYPVEKVLVASDWIDDVLKDEVIKAREIAKKKIKINWDD